jgi:hypothetical protein
VYIDILTIKKYNNDNQNCPLFGARRRKAQKKLPTRGRRAIFFLFLRKLSF